MKILFSGLAFLSRIPIPASWQLPQTQGAHLLLPYLWAAGILLGGLFATIAWGLIASFPVQLAFALMLPIQLAITGSFHEDGFADVADSMGGYTREKRLEIMHDSRLGTFGVGALASLLIIRWSGYQHLHDSDGMSLLSWFLLISGGWTRWASIQLMHLLPYIHSQGKGIAGAMRTPSLRHSLAGFLILLSLTLLAYPEWAPLVLSALLLSVTLCFFAFRKWVGGVNGDCLGACSIITEITLLAVICSIT